MYGRTEICKYHCLRNLHGSVSRRYKENPGPVTDACAVCTKGCRKNQMAIQCDSCDKWFHAKCISMKRTEYDKLCEPSLAWECITCLSPEVT